MGKETITPIEDTFYYCRHNNCDYYLRFNGEKRRIAISGYLAPGSRIIHKCTSCHQNNTFEGPEVKVSDEQIDKVEPKTVKSLLELGKSGD